MTTLRTEPASPASARPEPRIRVIYRDGSGQIHPDWPADQIAEALADREGTLWVDIEDPSRRKPKTAIEALLRDVFQFHPLAIEDALKETHVPRVDDWGDYLYLVFHSIDFDPGSDGRPPAPRAGHVPRPRTTWCPITDTRSTSSIRHRRNIERDPTNRLRHGADHVLYHLLDLCVAEYMPAIEHLDDGDRRRPGRGLRPSDAADPPGRSSTSSARPCGCTASSSPQREVLNRLARDEYDPIRPEHRVYFRDVYDHIVRIHDITETLRDLISGALDTYLSAVSNRTNDIMKTLTLVTVMFLPMSFLVGLLRHELLRRQPRRSTVRMPQAVALRRLLPDHGRHASGSCGSGRGVGSGSERRDGMLVGCVKHAVSGQA